MNVNVAEKQFQVEDYETGTAIEDFVTLEEAEQYCEKAEKQDRDEGTYTPGFYAIKNLLSGECERYNY